MCRGVDGVDGVEGVSRECRGRGEGVSGDLARWASSVSDATTSIVGGAVGEAVGAVKSIVAETGVGGGEAGKVCQDGPAIGVMRIHLHSALNLAPTPSFRPSGNYYVKVAILNANLVELTQVVYRDTYQNDSPQFDKFYEFEVPHYGSAVVLSLMY